jgi:Cu/Ag efflux protein CusF
MTAKSLTVVATALWLMGQTSPQTPTAQREASVSGTATITAIDPATRAVTLRTDKGEEDTLTAGPAVKRFDELKVGQKVKVTYYESLVFQVRKPGETADPKSDDLAFARAKSGLPAGAIATQQKRTVTVKSIDEKVPSITVTTDDGRVVTRTIQDKSKLAGVKVGDKIDITYTQAMLVNIEPVK